MSTIDQANGGAQPAPEMTEEIPAVHAVRILQRSLTSDGKAAYICFGLAPGMNYEKFALTMPAEMLRSVGAVIHILNTEHMKRNAPAGNVVLNDIKAFEVGNSDQFRGAVMIALNQHTEEEMIYVIADRGALELAKALQRDVLSRMSDAERAKVEAEMLGQAKPSILLPPGYRRQ